MKPPWLSTARQCLEVRLWNALGVLVPSKLVLETFLALVSWFCSQPPTPSRIVISLKVGPMSSDFPWGTSSTYFTGG